MSVPVRQAAYAVLLSIGRQRPSVCGRALRIRAARFSFGRGAGCSRPRFFSLHMPSVGYECACVRFGAAYSVGGGMRAPWFCRSCLSMSVRSGTFVRVRFSAAYSAGGGMRAPWFYRSCLSMSVRSGTFVRVRFIAGQRQRQRRYAGGLVASIGEVWTGT